ncbi:MAG: T9SS type A sorting domain-containing protein [Bacteroidia bacterium]
MKRNILFTLLIVMTVGMQSYAQDSVRVMHYNILRYGLDCNVDIATKTTWLKNIFDFYKPDILTINEIGPEEAYANRIKLQALTYAPMDYADNNNTANSFLVNRLFYNTDKFELVRLELIPGNLRDVDVWTLRDKKRAAAGDTLELSCIAMHLKAGSSSSDQSRRATAANAVMSWIQAKGPDFKNYLVMGDFNIGGASEPAWRAFTFNGNTDINLQDPTGKRAGWGASTVEILTQAPTTSRGDCGVGGGLDDRFDAILTSQAVLNNTAQYGYIPGSYEALGNDGRTPYDQELDCQGNTSVPSSICGNLKQASDHLPVVLQLLAGYPTSISQTAWPQAHLFIAPFRQNENPYLNIDISNQRREVELVIVNMQGQAIWNTTIEPNQTEVMLPMNRFAHGVYAVRIQNKQGRQKTLKFSW